MFVLGNFAKTADGPLAMLAASAATGTTGAMFTVFKDFDENALEHCDEVGKQAGFAKKKECASGGDNDATDDPGQTEDNDPDDPPTHTTGELDCGVMEVTQ